MKTTMKSLVCARGIKRAVCLAICGTVLAAATANAQDVQDVPFRIPARPAQGEAGAGGQVSDVPWARPGAGGQQGHERAPMFDRTRFAGERISFLTSDSRGAFPRLGDAFEVLAPSSEDYNAFSHTLGVYDSWIGPEAAPPYSPFAWADDTYGRAGFVRLPNIDLRLQAGTRKVVLYGTLSAERQIVEITAAARQEMDGTWSCKVGQMGLIRFNSPFDLAGDVYGVPIAVFAQTTQPIGFPVSR